MYNNSKENFNTETEQERQLVPYANFSIIKFLLTTKNILMGTIQYICLYGCVHMCNADICVTVHLCACKV